MLVLDKYSSSVGVACFSARISVRHNGCRKSLYLLCKCGTVNESSLALRKMKHIKDTRGRKKEAKAAPGLLFSQCQYILLHIIFYGTEVAVCCYAELHKSE